VEGRGRKFSVSNRCARVLWCRYRLIRHVFVSLIIIYPTMIGSRQTRNQLIRIWRTFLNSNLHNFSALIETCNILSTSGLAQALILLTSIREVPCWNIGRNIDYVRTVFVASRQMPAQYLAFGHDRFLTHPFQLSLSSNHWTLCSLSS
jgi:hypothetical protein